MNQTVRLCKSPCKNYPATGLPIMRNLLDQGCYLSSTKGLSIKNITGPDPVKFTESTEGSGPGLRNLSENDDLSVPECSSGSGSNR